MQTILASYINGNTTNTIYDNGTLVREWPDDELPIAEFPSSIDYAITNYCDAGCPHCHEQSTTKGVHGDVSEMLATLSTLPAGVEIAIGGGNPLDHPDLEEFLIGLKSRGLIANMTVNGIHINEKYVPKILDYRSKKLIHGLGISYNTKEKYRDNTGKSYNGAKWSKEGLFVNGIKINDDNTVVHVIAGVHTPIDVLSNIPTGTKMLILGYKDYGFGSRYMQNFDVDKTINKWRMYLPLFLSSYHISFDNLGVIQFNIREVIGEEKWNQLYMGDDGTFTMYVNGSSRCYATSSTKTRRPWKNNETVVDMFEDILHNKD